MSKKKILKAIILLLSTALAIAGNAESELKAPKQQNYPGTTEDFP